MAGGYYDDNNHATANGRTDSEIFDIEDNGWYTGPTIPRRFSSGGSASLNDGSIVLVGGKDENGPQSDIIRLNPSLMKFETMSGEIGLARIRFGMAVLLDNEDC